MTTFHRAMAQKLAKIGIGLSSVFSRQAINFRVICPEDGCNLDILDRASSTRVRLGDISSANQSNVRSHLEMQNATTPAIT